MVQYLRKVICISQKIIELFNNHYGEDDIANSDCFHKYITFIHIYSCVAINTSYMIVFVRPLSSPARKDYSIGNLPCPP